MDLDFAKAGVQHSAFTFSNEDLDNQIGCLENVIEYLENREDCGIIVNALRSELNNVFLPFKREREKNPELFK